jgi:Domain of unknown function (DUF5658)
MVRVARFPHAAALLVVIGCSTAAGAQELVVPADGAEAAATQSVTSRHVDLAAATPSSTRRPTALIPLYASFVSLQILDIHSTTTGLAAGGVEANPAMKAVAGNAIALSAVKAAGTAGLILVSEKLRTKNRAAAVGLMIAANSAMAWVVQHNYRVQGR